MFIGHMGHCKLFFFKLSSSVPGEMVWKIWPQFIVHVHLPRFQGQYTLGQPPVSSLLPAGGGGGLGGWVGGWIGTPTPPPPLGEFRWVCGWVCWRS